jgi:hypothetical protein
MPNPKAGTTMFSTSAVINNPSRNRKPREKASQHDIGAQDRLLRHGWNANSNPGTRTGSVNTTVCGGFTVPAHHGRYQVTTGHGLKPPVKDGRLPAKTKVDLDAACVWPDNSISAQVTPPRQQSFYSLRRQQQVWRRISSRYTGRCQSVRNRQRSSDAARGF